MSQGKIHVYTGNGKGKTTAAFGLCLRAQGQGLSSLIVQFLKHTPSGERMALADNPLIKVKNFGLKEFIVNTPLPEHLSACQKAIDMIKNSLHMDYNILVLDEINTALHFGAVKKTAVQEIIKDRPAAQEIILTGRNAPEWLISEADLVTEFKALKHYADKGLPARKGIEF